VGPRGEPLHDSAPQLRRIVRRRLGDEAADLLADPQPRSDGKAIDWFTDATGDVRRLADLDAARRNAVISRVELALGDIRQLGETLAHDSGAEETGLVGRSLQLATRLPDASFIFMVGDDPVVVCWGYDKASAAGLLATPSPAVPQMHRPVLQSPAAVAARPIAARPVVVPAAVPWARSLLLGVGLVALLLAGAWLLREALPDDPTLALATREGPLAARAAEPPPDPFPAMKASLSSEEDRGKSLQLELASLRSDLVKRIADCKPIEPPKPPEAAKPPPPPPPSRPPQVAVAPPTNPAPQPRPSDDRLRLPPAPTNNYAFLQGCWRTDPFRHEQQQNQPGISSYCFDSNGYGQLEWRRGRTACRTRAQARFEGTALRLRDSDTTCNDGSNWYADQLVCQRGADNVAQCSGSSRGVFGPVYWTVNLHKLQ
jgi:hypothetical protein